MAYVLALDQGTTNSRAIVFGHDEAIVALAQQEITQHFPRPGWVEHDAEEIWRTQHAVALQALRDAGLTRDDIAAIGIANQRETTLLWDRETGAPVHNAIVWQDRRTAEHCERLKAAGHEATVSSKTGLVIDPYFSGTKLAWLLDNVESARERAEAGRLAFGTVDAWLLYRLTGRHATDATNASRTLLYNIHTGTWDDELLAMLDVPASVLPEVVASSGVCGEARVEGLQGIPVAGVAGDQQAALFGQTCFRPGMTKNTYGTGCFALTNCGTRPPQSQSGLVTTVAWQAEGLTEYALEGSVFVAGAAVQWLRDGLGIIERSSDVEALAASVPNNGGVYMVPAFAGLGAPQWDPYARGTIVGLTRASTSGHIARATLEGIAYQVADILEVMQADTGIAIPELRVDGGAAANDLLMQFQADLLRVPVVRPRVTETTALGAAYLAGLATGFWQSRDEIAEHVAIDRRFEPSMPREQVQALQHQWRRALERSRGWAQ